MIRDSSEEDGEPREVAQERPGPGALPASESTSPTPGPRGPTRSPREMAPLDAGPGSGRGGAAEAPSFLLQSPPSARADTTKLRAPSAHRAWVRTAATTSLWFGVGALGFLAAHTRPQLYYFLITL